MLAEGQQQLAPATALALSQGDSDAWLRFFTDYHGVFLRALRAAAWRQQYTAGVEGLVDDAKTYFYGVFTRNSRSFVGEGQFRAFLFRTVQNFLLETRRRNRAEEPLTDASDGLDRKALAQWQEAAGGPSAATLTALQNCLGRLPADHRAVVLLHHFDAVAKPLSALAPTLGISVEAIHKRYQRALAGLRACMTAQKEACDVR